MFENDDYAPDFMLDCLDWPQTEDAGVALVLESPAGEIGNGFVLHLAVLEEGGAQEDAGLGFAVALVSTFIEIHSGYYNVQYNFL